MFKATMNHGFQLTFENGVTVSCQWGASNYCARYGEHLQPGWKYDEDLRRSIVPSETCEVMIWHESAPREAITAEVFESLQLEGVEDGVSYQTTADEVARILAFAAQMQI